MSEIDNFTLVSENCCFCNEQMSCSSDRGHIHICTIGLQPVHGMCLQEESSGNGVCKRCFVGLNHVEDLTDLFDTSDLVDTSRMIDVFQKIQSGNEIIKFVNTRIPSSRTMAGRSLTINRMKACLKKKGLVPPHLEKPYSNFKMGEIAEFVKIFSEIVDPICIKDIKDAALAPLMSQYISPSLREGAGGHLNGSKGKAPIREMDKVGLLAHLLVDPNSVLILNELKVRAYFFYSLLFRTSYFFSLQLLESNCQ